VRIRDIRDGTSQTLAMGEVNTNDYRFAYKGQYTIGVRTSGASMNAYPATYQAGYDCAYGSYHEGGAFFLFCDGQVRFLSENIDATTFASLGSRAGNELVDDEDY
jgi:uncharacterized protein DUF1559